MKKITTLLVIIVLVLLLISCSNNKETIELSFRITWDETSGRGDAIRLVVSSYNNSQDEVHVTMIGGDEDSEAIETLLTAEAGPEIIVLPYRFVQSFGVQNYLVPLDSYLESEIINHTEKVVELATIDNILYGFPWIGHSMCLIYNKDILDEAGINPLTITSFEDLGAAVALVESATDKKGIALVGADHHDLSWMTTMFINSFGGKLVNDSETEIPINSTESYDALDYYINTLGQYAQDNWEDHTGTEVMDAFREQETAFEIQGPWGITDIWKAGNPFEVGAISFTKLGGASEIGPMMLAIPTNVPEEKRDAAIDFIKFLDTIDALNQIMDGEYSPKHETFYPFRIPIRTDMVDSSYFTTYPEFKEFIYGFDNPSINTPIPEWATIHTEYYQPGLHSVIIGEMTIVDFLEMIEDEGNNLLNP